MVEQALAERFTVTLNQSDEPLDRDALRSAMNAYDVLCPTVSDQLDSDLLQGAGRVRLIANYGVGHDHIDLAAAKGSGIMVTNTPGVLTEATADLALALILAATRRTSEGERAVRAGMWHGWGPTHMLGNSLEGKVLGIVGFGRIGIATARRARHGFGMRIACYGRRPAEAGVTRELDAEFCPDLGDLLGKSDVVSLHVPGGAETTNMIDEQMIARMKRGSYLVNTARGTIVDHAALARALMQGHIAGAGLDVYPNEPEVPAELLDLPNVVLLPHMGSATTEARTAMGMRALANVECFARGEPLPDRIA